MLRNSVADSISTGTTLLEEYDTSNLVVLLNEEDGIQKNKNIIAFFQSEVTLQNIQPVLQCLKIENFKLYNMFIYGNKIDPDIVNNEMELVFVKAILRDEVIYKVHLKDFIQLLEGNSIQQIQEVFSYPEIYNQDEFEDDYNQDPDGGFGYLDQSNLSKITYKN